MEPKIRIRGGAYLKEICHDAKFSEYYAVVDASFEGGVDQRKELKLEIPISKEYYYHLKKRLLKSNPSQVPGLNTIESQLILRGNLEIILNSDRD